MKKEKKIGEEQNAAESWTGFDSGMQAIVFSRCE